MFAACGREAPAPAETPAREPRPAAAPIPPPGTAPQDRPGAPDPWADARARGIDFRAVGQEPGWYIEIDHESQLRLLYDYAEHEAVAAAPLPLVTDNQTTYAAATRDHTVSVVSETRICRDAMSGAEYPATVTVRIDGRELHGCGRHFE
jgi:putative lipoprotein